MGSFHAMGTEVTVLAPTVPIEVEDALTRRVAALFETAEQIFSRFRPESELSKLNRSTSAVRVPEAMFLLLSRARAYSELTRGVFDPTVGAALRASGYDRSFSPGVLDRDEPPPERAGSSPGFRAVELHAPSRTVVRAPEVELDLGGVAKGYAVDLAARGLPACAAIEAGGDACLRGDGDEGGGWLVDVEDPRDASRTLLTLRVRDGAVATSAANRRHWRFGERRMHHLIDPATGAPGDTDLVQATVVAPRAELADVLAKTAFLVGSREAERFLSRMPDVGGVLVTESGEVECIGRLEVARG